MSAYHVTDVSLFNPHTTFVKCPFLFLIYDKETEGRRCSSILLGLPNGEHQGLDSSTDVTHSKTHTFPFYHTAFPEQPVGASAQEQLLILIRAEVGRAPGVFRLNGKAHWS